MSAKSPVKRPQILEISASGRESGSVSRTLSRELTDALVLRHGDVEVVRRDLNDGIPFIDEDWISATFTPVDQRTADHERSLARSDELVAELLGADILVIGTPMYNFGVPAVLKAWIDMIARAGLTFRYTENGPVGLVRGKRAYIVLASGGVPLASEADFATPYLEHALRFIGFEAIDVVAADQLNRREAESVDAARVRIAKLVQVGCGSERRVA